MFLPIFFERCIHQKGKVSINEYKIPLYFHRKSN